MVKREKAWPLAADRLIVAALAVIAMIAASASPAQGVEANKLLLFVGVFIVIMLTMVFVPRIIIGYSGLLKLREIDYESAFLFTVLAYAGGLLTMLAGLVIIGQWVVGLAFNALMGVMILIYLFFCTIWAMRGFKMNWNQALVVSATTAAFSLACGAGLIYVFIRAFGSNPL